MKYIWQVKLNADEQEFPWEKVRFEQIKTPSPYMEIAFDELNRRHLDEVPIPVNAYFRFSAIFDHLIDGLNDYPELRDTLYDILMHYLAEINIREGLCRSEYYGLFLNEDVKSGKFGQRFSAVFGTFDRRHRRFVTECMVRLYGIGASITLFQSVMRRIYPKSIMYVDSVDRLELLIYIGKKETKELRRQVEFLISLFLPFDYVVHLFWDMHFGIISVDETMGVGEFVVY